MSYDVLLHPKAKAYLEDLDQEMGKRIRRKLEELKKYPERGNHLKYSAFWSLKIGDYRIIYEVNKKEQEVVILFIGHRKNVYDDFSKLF